MLVPLDPGHNWTAEDVMKSSNFTRAWLIKLHVSVQCYFLVKTTWQLRVS